MYVRAQRRGERDPVQLAPAVVALLGRAANTARKSSPAARSSASARLLSTRKSRRSAASAMPGTAKKSMPNRRRPGGRRSPAAAAAAPAGVAASPGTGRYGEICCTCLSARRRRTSRATARRSWPPRCGRPPAATEYSPAVAVGGVVASGMPVGWVWVHRPAATASPCAGPSPALPAPRGAVPAAARPP